MTDNIQLKGKKLVVRADASNSIGTGHIMRCLGIAQNWYDLGGEVYFIVSELPSLLEKRLITIERFNLIHISKTIQGGEKDAIETYKVFHSLKGDCIIIDGYNFLGDYQEFFMKRKVKTIVIDDHHYSDYYCTNLILNKGLTAETLNYNVKNSEPKFLLGPQYATLRREFLGFQRNRKYPTIASQVLISMGGSDPKNITTRIVKNLVEISENLNLKIIVGAAFNHEKQLQNQVKQLKGKYEIISNVNDMSTMMEKSDLAITAGGTTLYELAYMGLPSLTIKTVENQKSARFFDKLYGATVFLGDEKNLSDKDLFSANNIIFDKALRETIGESCMKLIDGNGNKRVINQIQNLVF